MLVLQGTTPEEVKNSVLELLEQEAARHERSSKSARLKGEAAQDRARANALRNVWHMLKHSTLADLNADKTRREAQGNPPAFTPIAQDVHLRSAQTAVRAMSDNFVPKVIPGNPATDKSTDDTK